MNRVNIIYPFTEVYGFESTKIRTTTHPRKAEEAKRDFAEDIYNRLSRGLGMYFDPGAYGRWRNEKNKFIDLMLSGRPKSENSSALEGIGDDNENGYYDVGFKLVIGAVKTFLVPAFEMILSDEDFYRDIVELQVPNNFRVTGRLSKKAFKPETKIPRRDRQQAERRLSIAVRDPENRYDLSVLGGEIREATKDKKDLSGDDLIRVASQISDYLSAYYVNYGGFSRLAYDPNAPEYKVQRELEPHSELNGFAKTADGLAISNCHLLGQKGAALLSWVRDEKDEDRFSIYRVGIYAKDFLGHDVSIAHYQKEVVDAEGESQIEHWVIVTDNHNVKVEKVDANFDVKNYAYDYARSTWADQVDKSVGISIVVKPYEEDFHFNENTKKEAYPPFLRVESLKDGREFSLPISKTGKKLEKFQKGEKFTTEVLDDGLILYTLEPKRPKNGRVEFGLFSGNSEYDSARQGYAVCQFSFDSKFRVPRSELKKFCLEYGVFIMTRGSVERNGTLVDILRDSRDEDFVMQLVDKLIQHTKFNLPYDAEAVISALLECSKNENLSDEKKLEILEKILRNYELPAGVLDEKGYDDLRELSEQLGREWTAIQEDENTNYNRSLLFVKGTFFLAHATHRKLKEVFAKDKVGEISPLSGTKLEQDVDRLLSIYYTTDDQLVYDTVEQNLFNLWKYSKKAHLYLAKRMEAKTAQLSQTHPKGISGILSKRFSKLSAKEKSVLSGYWVRLSWLDNESEKLKEASDEVEAVHLAVVATRRFNRDSSGNYVGGNLENSIHEFFGNYEAYVRLSHAFSSEEKMSILESFAVDLLTHPQALYNNRGKLREPIVRVYEDLEKYGDKKSKKVQDLLFAFEWTWKLYKRFSAEDYQKYYSGVAGNGDNRRTPRISRLPAALRQSAFQLANALQWTDKAAYLYLSDLIRLPESQNSPYDLGAQVASFIECGYLEGKYLKQVIATMNNFLREHQKDRIFSQIIAASKKKDQALALEVVLAIYSPEGEKHKLSPDRDWYKEYGEKVINNPEDAKLETSLESKSLFCGEDAQSAACQAYGRSMVGGLLSALRTGARVSDPEGQNRSVGQQLAIAEKLMEAVGDLNILTPLDIEVASSSLAEIQRSRHRVDRDASGKFVGRLYEQATRQSMKLYEMPNLVRAARETKKTLVKKGLPIAAPEKPAQLSKKCPEIVSHEERAKCYEAYAYAAFFNQEVFSDLDGAFEIPEEMAREIEQFIAVGRRDIGQSVTNAANTSYDMMVQGLSQMEGDLVVETGGVEGQELSYRRAISGSKALGKVFAFRSGTIDPLAANKKMRAFTGALKQSNPMHANYVWGVLFAPEDQMESGQSSEILFHAPDPSKPNSNVYILKATTDTSLEEMISRAEAVPAFAQANQDLRDLFTSRYHHAKEQYQEELPDHLKKNNQANASEEFRSLWQDWKFDSAETLLHALDEYKFWDAKRQSGELAALPPLRLERLLLMVQIMKGGVSKIPVYIGSLDSGEWSIGMKGGSLPLVESIDMGDAILRVSYDTEQGIASVNTSSDRQTAYNDSVATELSLPE